LEEAPQIIILRNSASVEQALDIAVVLIAYALEPYHVLVELPLDSLGFMQVGEMLALLIVAVHDEQFSHKLTTRSTPNFREVLVTILGHHFRLETYDFCETQETCET
jgi:hypothetical protein